MNNPSINKAETEARRFLRAIKEYKDHDEQAKEKPSYWLWGTRWTAAIRRTSMDLTRALADMRKCEEDMTPHGTTISRNIVDLLDLPALEVEWFVYADVDKDGSIEMPLTVARETLPTAINDYAIALINHIWDQIHQFEAETRDGKNEAIDDLQPI